MKHSLNTKTGIFLYIGVAALFCLIFTQRFIQDSTPFLDWVNRILSITGLVFEVLGVYLISRSDAVQNSRLHKWKMKLIGRAEK